MANTRRHEEQISKAAALDIEGQTIIKITARPNGVPGPEEVASIKPQIVATDLVRRPCGL